MIKYLKYGVIVAVVLYLLLKGATNTEDVARKKILDELNDKYDSQFEIAYIEYNKTYKCYDAYVINENLKGAYPAEASYYSKDGVFENYYQQLYCNGIDAEFAREFALSGDFYVCSHFWITNETPKKGLSYEEYIEKCNVANGAVTINLFYEYSGEDIKYIEDGISVALMAMDSQTIKADVYLISKEELADVRAYMDKLDVMAANKDLFRHYDKALIISKRDGEIKEIDEKDSVISKLLGE